MKINSFKKAVFGILLAFFMIATITPVTAYAENENIDKVDFVLSGYGYGKSIAGISVTTTQDFGDDLTIFVTRVYETKELLVPTETEFELNKTYYIRIGISSSKFVSNFDGSCTTLTCNGISGKKVNEYSNSYTGGKDWYFTYELPKLTEAEIPFTKVVRQTGDITPGTQDFELKVETLPQSELNISDFTISSTVTTNGTGEFPGKISITSSDPEKVKNLLREGIIVKEKAGSSDDWDYDETVWLVVEKNNIKAAASPKLNYFKGRITNGEFVSDTTQGEEEFTFTNTYKKVKVVDKVDFVMSGYGYGQEIKGINSHVSVIQDYSGYATFNNLGTAGIYTAYTETGVGTPPTETRFNANKKYYAKLEICSNKLKSGFDADDVTLTCNGISCESKFFYKSNVCSLEIVEIIFELPELSSTAIQIPFTKEVEQKGNMTPENKTFELEISTLPQSNFNISGFDIGGLTIITEGAGAFEGKISIDYDDYMKLLSLLDEGILIKEKKDDSLYWEYDETVWLVKTNGGDELKLNYFKGKIVDGEFVTDNKEGEEGIVFTNSYTRNRNIPTITPEEPEKPGTSEINPSTGAPIAEICSAVLILSVSGAAIYLSTKKH